MIDHHEPQVTNFVDLPDSFARLWQTLGGGAWSNPHRFVFDQIDVSNATVISHDNNPLHKETAPSGRVWRAVVPGALIPLMMPRILPGLLQVLLGGGFKPILSRIECNLQGLIRVGDPLLSKYQMTSMSSRNLKNTATLDFVALMEHETSGRPAATCKFSMVVSAERGHD